MDDIDESSSENNVTINAINRFAASPHQIGKNAYHFTVVKDAGSNSYRSRIGFDMHPLPSWARATINASATIGSQTSQTIAPAGSVAGDVRTLIQFHRWSSVGLQYLYLDLHGETSVQTTERMVVYGVQCYVPNVDPRVFDTLYVLENGRMELQTDLDLRRHRLMYNGQGGFSFDSGQMTMHSALNTNGYRVVDVVRRFGSEQT